MPSDSLPISNIHECWFVTGATATGKTRVGIEIAKQIKAEVISLDSMAVYRGMNIGTAKATAEQLAEVPHHLIDLVEPSEEFSVAEFLLACEMKIEEIRSRGRTVLFVGGTPLYLKTLLRGMYQGPPADWEFREEVEREVTSTGMAPLLERLQQVDPLAAAKLHPHDKRRIIRALEVYKITGHPISHQQIHFDDDAVSQAKHVFVLSLPRPALHRRIEKRVDRMFELGLVEEVRSLLVRHRCLSRTALQAVGYREVVEHLEGKHSLSETVELVKQRTRQFARRQETWFRRLSECQNISIDEAANVREIVGEIRRRCD